MRAGEVKCFSVYPPCWLGPVEERHRSVIQEVYSLQAARWQRAGLTAPASGGRREVQGETVSSGNSTMGKFQLKHTL